MALFLLSVRNFKNQKVIIWINILTLCCYINSMKCSNDYENQYLGCYYENVIRSDIEAKTITFGNYSNLTIDWCINSCRERAYTFVGLQNGSTCHCLDTPTYLTYNKNSNQNDCHTVCQGDNTGLCGGLWVISLYAVCPFGFYGIGDESCTLECPGECESANDMPGICHVTSGTCLSPCKYGWSGEKCTVSEMCSSLSGHPCMDNYMDTSSNTPNESLCTPNTKSSSVRISDVMVTEQNLYIFPQLKFTKNGNLSQIQYFAENKGKFYVSVWELYCNDLKNYTVQMVGKILIDSTPGFHSYSLPVDARFPVNTGNVLGIHHPSTNTAAIAITFNSNNTRQTDDNTPMILSSFTDENDWFPGYTQNISAMKLDNTLNISSVSVPVKLYLQCDTGCPANTFGSECMSKCGQCQDDLNCDPTTGVCPSGCQDGWEGLMCDRQVNISVATPTITVSKIMSAISTNDDVINTGTTTYDDFNQSDISLTTKSQPLETGDNTVKVTIGLALGIVIAVVLLVVAVIAFTRCELRSKQTTAKWNIALKQRTVVARLAKPAKARSRYRKQGSVQEKVNNKKLGTIDSFV